MFEGWQPSDRCWIERSAYQCTGCKMVECSDCFRGVGKRACEVRNERLVVVSLASDTVSSALILTVSYFFPTTVIEKQANTKRPSYRLFRFPVAMYSSVATYIRRPFPRSLAKSPHNIPFS